MRVWVFIREKPLEAYELVSFNLRLHDLFKKKIYTLPERSHQFTC